MVRQMEENSTVGSITELNTGEVVWLVGLGFFFFVACLQWKSWGDRSVKAGRVGVKKNGFPGEAWKGKVEKDARTLLQTAR